LTQFANLKTENKATVSYIFDEDGFAVDVDILVVLRGKSSHF
jgi:hypothetical protein